MAALRLAYITSAYPHVSHTFILREVNELRRQGVQLETFVVRAAKEHEILSAADREAARTTYALRPPRPADFIGAHLRAVLTGRPYLPVALRILRRSRSPSSLIRQVAYFVQGVVLWDRMRRHGIRHAHAHFANVSSDVAMVSAMVGGEGWSWSFTMHGSTEFSDVKFFRLEEKVREARFVVCISDYARGQLMALVEPAHWAKLHVVHCGVNSDEFRPMPRRGASTLHVLCVGRLTPVKGHVILLEAVARARAAGIGVELTLVGDGETRADIEAAINRLGLWENVRLVGAAGQDEIRRYFAEADVFALTSFMEGVPVVLMEAMAMELPVVATRVAGIPELVEDGVSGILVTPGRPDEAALALAALASDRRLRRSLGSAGRRRVQEEFEVSRCVATLHEVFAQELGLRTVEASAPLRGSAASAA